MSRISFLFGFFLFASLQAQAETQSSLRPFTSDGCSSFPDGTFAHKELWLTCCTAHDFSYWKGGTYKDRLEADRALRDCVSSVGEPEVALIMLAGVRVGGSPFWPTKFRWGYGWPWPRFYRELDEEEIEQVSALAAEYFDSIEKSQNPLTSDKL